MKRASRKVLCSLLFLIVVFGFSNGFYLPGVAPTDYPEGAELQVFANKLTSARSNVPYDFYFLPFCEPTEEKEKTLNIGQLFLGERAKSTAFEISMLKNEDCKVLCEKLLEQRDIARLKRLVKREYRARLNLDNMPLVVKKQTPSGENVYQFGYQIGFREDKKIYVNNHLRLKILYHRPSSMVSSDLQDVYRVVGFEVEPVSMTHRDNPGSAGFCPLSPEPFEALVGKRMYYTYDIVFEESPIRWATRWDPLLSATEEQKQIQWFSIINSLLITLFLSGMVAMILFRTIHKDFMRYNQLSDDEDFQEEVGWKLLHGDVFRPPPYSSVLCILVGNGAQVLVIAIITLLFALFGFLSPANRGALLSCMVALWVLTSAVAGYSSARLYKSLGGIFVKRVVLGTALIFPGCVFSVFFILNFLIWLSQSHVSVPFSTLVLLLFLWFGISIPLAITGAYIGLRRTCYTFPCRTNQIPRKIPPQPWYSGAVFTCLIGGILPFGSVFIQLVFILGSLWQNQIYYMFGFLSAVFIVFMITSMEISVVLCYLKLCSEDYRWWFYSFFCAGSSGLYVFLYSIFYLLTQPEFEGIDLLSVLVYVGYMVIASISFTLVAGFLGFRCCFWFTRKIYSSIRVD
ncbi:endomembrane protein-like protein [Galdieria sulphuraria]|uniref:Transmembrane 9 superfamily member n=1 Tax=Galdieria sulphuraria TaxID=130081 RepID=M2W8F9_GALSU|nr:endomembrane protein-like protein [Galdieria sulphuraria]EME32166.1 endomembrane protein-like protein [Galdieria sulphuraria]|eukprot:XP_005708686.1 endomembrane protein-like protein [Galdieria sulphuraria]